MRHGISLERKILLAFLAGGAILLGAGWFAAAGGALGLAVPGEDELAAGDVDSDTDFSSFRSPGVALTESGVQDIWMIDIARNVATRMTLNPADDVNPIWSPDGTRLASASFDQTVRMFVSPAGGPSATPSRRVGVVSAASSSWIRPDSTSLQPRSST